MEPLIYGPPGLRLSVLEQDRWHSCPHEVASLCLPASARYLNTSLICKVRTSVFHNYMSHIKQGSEQTKGSSVTIPVVISYHSSWAGEMDLSKLLAVKVSVLNWNFLLIPRSWWRGLSTGWVESDPLSPDSIFLLSTLVMCGWHSGFALRSPGQLPWSGVCLCAWRGDAGPSAMCWEVAHGGFLHLQRIHSKARVLKPFLSWMETWHLMAFK